VEYRFHGKLVKADPRLDAIFKQEWVPRMGDFLKVLVRSEVFLKPEEDQES
jgi:hypothetical protein